MKPDPTISQRGFAMLEAIKRECGIDAVAEAVVESSGRIYCASHSYRKPREPRKRHRAKAGEMRLMPWVLREAARLNVKRSVVYYRFLKGIYTEALQIRRVNRRVIFVRPTGEKPRESTHMLPGEWPLGLWVKYIAIRLGKTERAIWVSIYRGALKIPPSRRINKRVIFVRVRE